MIQKVSIVQNDHTNMVIIKTCNRTHKNKNYEKNYEMQVQKHTKPKISEISPTKEKIVKLEYHELRYARERKMTTQVCRKYTLKDVNTKYE